MVNLEALRDIDISDQQDVEEEGSASINEIILRQIRKLGDIASSELTGGYWQKKPIKTSGGIMFSEEYHEDKREAYSNAVDFIVDLVYPISDDAFRKIIDNEEIFDKQEKLSADYKEKRLLSRKKIFRELNKMFERVEFFNTSIDVTNTST